MVTEEDPVHSHHPNFRLGLQRTSREDYSPSLVGVFINDYLVGGCHGCPIHVFPPLLRAGFVRSRGGACHQLVEPSVAVLFMAVMACAEFPASVAWDVQTRIQSHRDKKIFQVGGVSLSPTALRRFQEAMIAVHWGGLQGEEVCPKADLAGLTLLRRLA